MSDLIHHILRHPDSGVFYIEFRSRSPQYRGIAVELIPRDDGNFYARERLGREVIISSPEVTLQPPYTLFSPAGLKLLSEAVKCLQSPEGKPVLDDYFKLAGSGNSGDAF